MKTVTASRNDQAESNDFPGDRSTATLVGKESSIWSRPALRPGCGGAIDSHPATQGPFFALGAEREWGQLLSAD